MSKETAARLFCTLTQLLYLTATVAPFRMRVMTLGVFSCPSQSVRRKMSHLLCSRACCPAPLVIICLCITEHHLWGFICLHSACCTGCVRPFHRNLSSELEPSEHHERALHQRDFTFHSFAWRNVSRRHFHWSFMVFPLFFHSFLSAGRLTFACDSLCRALCLSEFYSARSLHSAASEWVSTLHTLLSLDKATKMNKHQHSE